MRAFLSTIALLTAGAVACHTLPAQALPEARVNLVRIDGDGVQPLPDLTRLLRQARAIETRPEGAPEGEASAAEIVAQALPAAVAAEANAGIFFLPSASEDLRIRLRSPLPSAATGELLLRLQRSPWQAATSGPEAGEVVERLPLSDDRVNLSDDRRYLQINPERTLQSGDVITVDFTALDLSALGAAADPETPVRFALPETACLFQGPALNQQEDQPESPNSRSALLGEEDDSVVFLLSPGDDLELSFSRPLPSGLSGTLLLRDQPSPGDERVSGPAAGEVVERIAISSEQVFRSEDGLFMAVTPQTRRTLGWITTLDLSELTLHRDPGRRPGGRGASGEPPALHPGPAGLSDRPQDQALSADRRPARQQRCGQHGCRGHRRDRGHRRGGGDRRGGAAGERRQWRWRWP